MHVLVAYASRHGATAGIAERIGQRLRDAGLEADVRPAASAGDPGAYDAVVLGSAAYMFRWLGEATSFAKRHRAALASRPLWVFTSGPIGTDTVDDKGRDVRESAVSSGVKELVAGLGARDHHVFSGVYYRDRPRIGLAEHVMAVMPAGRDALPEGDFRDWTEIDAWADGIADALVADALVAAAPPVAPALA